MATYGSDTVLLVVDVQNDFADAKGSLYVSGAEEILPLVNQELQQARAAGALVVFTQDWHPQKTPHFEDYGGIWPVHCVKESWGAAFHPELKVQGVVVRKGSGGEDGYSGFTVKDPRSEKQTRTELEELLRASGIQRVVVCGLATDYCVKDTVVDAARLGFEVEVRRAAVRAVNLEPGDEERAYKEMAEAGARIA
jgi:nicotinamidase/pyrazinamidase